MDDYWKEAFAEWEAEKKRMEESKPKAEDHIARFKEWFGEDVPVTSATDYGEVTFTFTDREGVSHELKASYREQTPHYGAMHELVSMSWEPSWCISGKYNRLLHVTEMKRTLLVSACQYIVDSVREWEERTDRERKEAQEKELYRLESRSSLSRLFESSADKERRKELQDKKV